eukprot:14811266-Ditylum_brightwellii.AAC.1
MTSAGSSLIFVASIKEKGTSCLSRLLVLTVNLYAKPPMFCKGMMVAVLNYKLRNNSTDHLANALTKKESK